MRFPSGRIYFWAIVLSVGLLASRPCLLAAGEEIPPIGYDALLRLDKLPLLANWPAYQDGSYSRKDDNSDEGNFLRIEKNGEQVMVDTDGPGVIYRIWSTGVVGRQMSDKCRFMFYFDSEEKPRFDLSVPELFGVKGSKYPFVPPLSVTFESGAKGNAAEGPCNLCYVPIPFQKHIKITGRNVAFYHVNYHKLPPGTEVPSWTQEWADSQKDKHAKGAALFAGVGYDPKPATDGTTRRAGGTIAPGNSISLTMTGPGSIDRLQARLSKPTSKMLRGVVLRMTFDDAQGPSVLTPFGDFFGTGGGDRRFKTLMSGMTDEGYYSFWPMPFAKKAVLEIVNDTPGPVTVDRFEVTEHGVDKLPSNIGYFHAQYVQNPDCQVGKEYTILDVKGHRGKYVGVNITMQNARGGQGIFFLEGDEKIYCDGEKWPSRWLGTGTEDYYNGSYFWNHPDKAGMVRPLGGPTFLDWGIGRVCAYRWQVTDWVGFQRDIRVDQEHGGTNEIPANYQSVAYYYLDAPTAQRPLPEEARMGILKLNNPPYMKEGVSPSKTEDKAVSSKTEAKAGPGTLETEVVIKDEKFSTWHDRTGWFDLNAKVLSFKGGKDDDGKETILVTLRRKNDFGTGLWEVTFPIETFHPSNQKELLAILKKAKSP